ncbi:MAG: hypothetical protein M4579_005007 [Chaenotheca gracillima]|nr:MAG: hypothetical protein M4579_005007 [Chaenotheca gracillima]
MAANEALPRVAQGTSAPQRVPVSIEEWASTQAARIIEASRGNNAQSPLTLRQRATLGGSGPRVPLSIPLDGADADADDDAAGTVRRRVVLRPRAGEPEDEEVEEGKPARWRPRRDSLKRREALLKGKEGSRRRQRWENDRLLSNPHAQPPLPSDWQVQPTYPRLPTVPYYLAPLWDGEMGRRAAKRRDDEEKSRRNTAAAQSSAVPRDLKETLKRRKAAKGLLRDLEEDVREWVIAALGNAALDGKALERDGEEVFSSEDEEIVFVGRNGSMRDGRGAGRKKSDSRLDDEAGRLVAEMEKLVLDSPAEDKGASFARWLVHTIASYYGLRAWSVTVGDPARREAYVGISAETIPTARTGSKVTGMELESIGSSLPRPLWGMV